MARGKSLRARSRGGGRKGPGNAAVGDARERDARQPELPPEPQPEPEPRREPAELRLDGDHPLCKLQELYARQTGGPRPLPPCLSMEPLLEQIRARSEPERDAHGKLAVVLTEAEATQELERLKSLVDRTAAKRLADIEEQRAIAAVKAAERAARSVKKGEEPPPPPSPADMPPPDMDFDAEVFITARRMAAWLVLYPPSGKGKDISKKALERVLDAVQVVSGVDEALLRALPDMPERYFTPHLIALGTMPVHGKDGSVIDLFPRERKHVPKEDEQGRVDFASIELFHNVHEGDMICRISYPTEPVSGKTVQGQVLPARRGHPPEIPRGQNTRLSEDRGSLLASCDGHVEFSGKRFNVKPVLDIPGNVDFSTGNINCVGDVHIHGDVCGGFSVKATGNITVDGVIEACAVEAGGDLVIRKGVQGGGTGVLRGQRSIYTKYVESATVYVRENLEAESLISCKVYSDRDVAVRSGRGVIVGGEVHAAHDVSANIVGSRAELLTVVRLGGQPFEDFERAELTETIGELEKRLEKLERQPDSPAKLQRMSKTRMLIAANKLKLRRLDQEIGQMGGSLEEMETARGRLSGGVVYPGTELTIDGCFLRVAHETHSCVSSVSDGEVTLI